MRGRLSSEAGVCGEVNSVEGSAGFGQTLALALAFDGEKDKELVFDESDRQWNRQITGGCSRG